MAKTKFVKPPKGDTYGDPTTAPDRLPKPLPPKNTGSIEEEIRMTSPPTVEKIVQKRKALMPEEEESGNEYIQKREQLASRLGVSSKRAGELLVDEEQLKQQEGINKRESEAATAEFTKAEQEQAAATEKAGIKEGVMFGKGGIFERGQKAETFEEKMAYGKEQLNYFVGAAAEIFDGFRAITTLGGRKSNRVQAAEAAFTDASAVLKSNIELVKTGQMQSYQALKAFDLANEAINRLQRTNTGIGKLNLRYWLDEGGKETEVSIIREQTEIDSLRIELLNAIAIGAIV